MIRPLSLNECMDIHGAHGTPSSLTTLGILGGTLVLFTEFNHFRESFNYFADRWENGCGNIEAEDRFTALICAGIQKVMGNSTAVKTDL